MISLSRVKDNAADFLKLSAVSGFSAITTVKTAQFLRSYASRGMVSGFICGSGLNNHCRLGTVGRGAIPLCAERIKWLQPLKPMLNFLGHAVNDASAFPGYILGFNQNSIFNTSLRAIGEEIFCYEIRLLIRKLQEKVIMQFSTNPEALIDHPITKISRIAATSILFGLMHTHAWECGYGGTIPEVAAGVIFGILAETQQHGLISSSLAHITCNLILG